MIHESKRTSRVFYSSAARLFAAMVILFNKPYGVLCNSPAEGAHGCLNDYIDVPGVYPAGRLDADSEGLLVLTDDGTMQARIADPRRKLPRLIGRRSKVSPRSKPCKTCATVWTWAISPVGLARRG